MRRQSPGSEGGPCHVPQVFVLPDVTCLARVIHRTCHAHHGQRDGYVDGLNPVVDQQHGSCTTRERPSDRAVAGCVQGISLSRIQDGIGSRMRAQHCA